MYRSLFDMLMRLLDEVFEMLDKIISEIWRKVPARQLLKNERALQSLGIFFNDAGLRMSRFPIRGFGGLGSAIALTVAAAVVVGIVYYSLIAPLREMNSRKTPESFRYTSIAPKAPAQPVIDRNPYSEPSIRRDYDYDRREYTKRQTNRTEALADINRYSPDDGNMDSVREYTNQVVQPINNPVKKPSTGIDAPRKYRSGSFEADEPDVIHIYENQ
jgi:hypothetical protein